MFLRAKDTLIAWAGTAVFMVAFVLCALLDKAFDLWNGNLWSDEQD